MVLIDVIVTIQSVDFVIARLEIEGVRLVRGKRGRWLHFPSIQALRYPQASTC